MNATDFKNNLGQYLIKMYREAVVVTKMGRPTAVLLSYDEYDKLLKQEEQRKQAEGLYGTEKEQALTAIRNELRQLRREGDRRVEGLKS